MVGKTDGERVSIWSVGDRERLFFVGLSLAFFAIGLWFALCHIMQDGFTNEAIFDSIKIIGPIGLSAITLTFFLMEGRNLMLVPIEKYRRKRYEAVRQEGRQEGHQEVLATIQEKYPNIDLAVIRAALEEKNGSGTDDHK